MKKKLLFAIGLSLVAGGPASAQTPTYILPFGNGYAVQTPGQAAPTIIQPFGGGGYMVQTPNGTGLLQQFGNGYIYQPPPEPPQSSLPIVPLPEGE